jgi:hypothetical protein
LAAFTKARRLMVTGKVDSQHFVGSASSAGHSIRHHSSGRVYGGRLVAAVDRRHPRDLFDVLQLFAHEGITAGILCASSSISRAITGQSMRSCSRRRATSAQAFEHNFTGMTAEPVVRERMMRELQQGLNAVERRFLLSLVAAEPEWPLLGVPHLGQFLGPRWKLQNLERLRKANARKFAEQSDTLLRRLR